MSAPRDGKIGILVGGGPAPGIDGVISAVVLEASRQGRECLGIRDGYKHIGSGDLSSIVPITLKDIPDHFARGGSMLGAGRSRPSEDDSDVRNILSGFEKLGITGLVAIGGEGTGTMARKLHTRSGGKIRVAHVPKTIDNDLPLPSGIPTFGFETARHLGSEIAENLKEDARSTNKWYLVATMGRTAGHLALGIGNASNATLTLIGEEFHGKSPDFNLVCDILIGAMVKRKVMGKNYGVAVCAEGLLEAMGVETLQATFGDSLSSYGTVERDPLGRLRLGELDFGRMLRDGVKRRLAGSPFKPKIVHADLGYELRSAPPIPLDVEYVRNLGYGAVKFLLSHDDGLHGATICYVGDRMVPVSFDEFLEPGTDRLRRHLVDVTSEQFRCARSYMIRLNKADFQNHVAIAQYATELGMTPEEFRIRFLPAAANGCSS